MMADPDSEVEHFASSSDESDPEIEVERVGGRVNPYQFEPAREFHVRDGEEPILTYLMYIMLTIKL